MWKKLYLLFILFTFLYNINYSFFPIPLVAVMALVGGCIFINDFFKRGYIVSFLLIKLVFFLCSIPLVFLATTLFNDIDLFYLKEHFLYVIVLLFSAYFIFRNFSFFVDKGEFLNTIFKYLIFCVLLQSVLSLLMFFNSTLKSILLSLVKLDSDNLDNVLGLSEFRLVGFGTQFFGAGVINALILGLITFLVVTKSNGFNLRYLKFIYIYIFIVGMAMARTTILGVFLSVFVVLYYKLLFEKKFYIIIKYIFYLVVSYVLVGLFISLISSTFLSLKDNKLIGFGFEMLIKLFEGEGMSSKSTDAMVDMYNIVPDNISTWLIGDGKFRDNGGVEYYMGTDIGYLRIIFATGIIGLVYYLLAHFLCCRVVFRFKEYKVLGWMLFLLLVLLLFKGIMIVYPIISLIVISIYYERSKSI